MPVKRCSLHGQSIVSMFKGECSQIRTFVVILAIESTATVR